MKTLNVKHQELVQKALQLGYTHLDMAWTFPTHRDPKKVFPDIKRDEYKVIMKVMPGFPPMRMIEAYDGFVDVMLVHWPGVYNLKPEDPKNETARHDFYAQLEKLHKEGQIGEIGLSNFNDRHVNRLVEQCEVKPHYNAFELHPLYIEKETIKACRDNDIKIMSYTPLSMMKTDIPPIDLLSWHDENGFIPIPLTENLAHLEENTKRRKLTTQDHVKINALAAQPKMHWNPNAIL